jgi:hypothetical protein
LWCAQIVRTVIGYRIGNARRFRRASPMLSFAVGFPLDPDQANTHSRAASDPHKLDLRSATLRWIKDDCAALPYPA